MAAMVEGIPIVSAGLTMVYHVLPAAHVTLDSAALATAPTLRRMRVAAAGMLHNVLLTVLCAILSLAAQHMLASGYLHTRGAVVRYAFVFFFLSMLVLTHQRAYLPLVYTRLLYLFLIVHDSYCALYSHHVMFRGVAPMSDLAQHLPIGALITGVGICPVHSVRDWTSCVQHTVEV